MIKYRGKLTMDERYTKILNISKSLIEFLEIIYLRNINNKSCSILITDKRIVNELNLADSENERLKIIEKSKLLYSHYKKKLFANLLCDFCQYMYESVHCVFGFKPQIAYTLARKPLIDDVFYFQYLYLKPDEVIDIILSDNASDKDVGNKNSCDEDKEQSKIISERIGFAYIDPFTLRRDKEVEYSILNNCNKSMHISTSRQTISITQSGELNFIFMDDNVIEDYLKLYLNTVPLLLFYVGRIVLSINEWFNGEDKMLNSLLNKLQKQYEDTIKLL